MGGWVWEGGGLTNDRDSPVRTLALTVFRSGLQIRQRDSTEQSRMNIDELYSYLSKEIEGF